MANPGAAEHYNEDYFNWQKNIGAFGGKANLFKFNKTVKSSDTVIDFGCGGGYLLANLNCRTRIGIEPNESASNAIDKNGVKHFFSPKQCLDELGESCTDVIISDNALEHTLNPLEELKSLYPLLKSGGTIHFVVPCHSIGDSYNPKDTNYHLYSWSPQNLGNLFTEAGFSVKISRPYIHKWPPFYRYVARLGWPLFNFAARIYGRIERSWFQVEVIAVK